MQLSGQARELSGRMFGTSSPMYGFLHFTGRGRERIKPRPTGGINRYVGCSPWAVPYESQARVQRIPQWYFHRGLSKWTGLGEHMGGRDPECAGVAASRDESRVHQAREYACDAQGATSGVRWGATFLPATVKAVYTLSHRLPAPKCVIVAAVQEHLKQFAHWEGERYTS